MLRGWSPVFPAFRILDDVTLWYHDATVDGVAKMLPVSLADVALALIFAVATVVLAKRLPATLEIALLSRSEMSAGDRYTVTTLTNYAVITIGLVLVFKTLGTDWSKLQWLAAALGVGVGFGHQEIVANSTPPGSSLPSRNAIYTWTRLGRCRWNCGAGERVPRRPDTRARATMQIKER